MSAFLIKWKKYLTFAGLLSCFVNILQLTFPFYMFTIYSNIILSYSEFSLATITSIAFFAVFILGLFSYLRSRLLAQAGKDLNLKLRQTVYSSTVKGCVIDPKRAYQGGVNDLEVLQNYFASSSVYSLFDAPWAPFYLILIYLFHPVLGLIATLGAAFMVGLSVVQEFLVRKSMKEANIMNSQNQRFVDSFMRNAQVINGMGMIPNITDRYIKGNSQVMINQTKSSNYAGVIQSIIKPMQNVIQVMIYCFGAYYAMTQGFNVGLMVAASIIMGRGLAPLMQLMSSWRFFSQAKESYNRLKSFSAMQELQTPTMQLPKPEGCISVEGAVFKISDQILLKGVSFKLDKGEFLGIIGPSGAGKTTLCRLLLGIWPSMGGKVYFDNTDICSWDKDKIGQYIGYLPQEVELFPGSVAQNIARLGRIDTAILEHVCKISNIQNLIELLPQGLDTQLGGEEGINLSGGQKQKIGLARALYGGPRLLVLDEPTSNLDEQGEQSFLNTLSDLKQNQSCTCIMVTHKPSLLQSMDKLMVLKDGLVAKFGPKDEVFSEISGQQSGDRKNLTKAII